MEKITVIRGPSAVVAEAPPDGNPGRWRLKVPVEAPGDPETIGRALNKLADLRAESLVTDKPASDEKYGLDKPALVLKWKLRDEFAPAPRLPTPGEETTLSVGGLVPGKAGLRGMRRGCRRGPIVFTVSAPEIVALFEAEWRDRTVFTLDPKSTDRIALRWPSLTLMARPVPDPKAKDGDPDWTHVDPPKAVKLDQAQLKPLVKSPWRSSRPSASRSTPARIAPETGLFPPRLAVEVQPSGQASPRTLRIGRSSPDSATCTRRPNPARRRRRLPASDEQLGPWLQVRGRPRPRPRRNPGRSRTRPRPPRQTRTKLDRSPGCRARLVPSRVRPSPPDRLGGSLALPVGTPSPAPRKVVGSRTEANFSEVVLRPRS